MKLNLSQKLKSKKKIAITISSCVILAALFVLGYNFYYSKKQTKADFSMSLSEKLENSNDNNLYVAAGELLYIGAGDIPVGGDPDLDVPGNSGGQVDKIMYHRHTNRLWSDIAPKWDSRSEVSDWQKKRFDKPASVPADGVYTKSNLVNIKDYTGSNADGYTNKWTGCPHKSGQTEPSVCYAIISDGSGIIVNFPIQIKINGTVVIGDRVVLQSESIQLGPSARILGNGQKGGPGIGDSNGFGGAGGVTGGTAWFASSTCARETNFPQKQLSLEVTAQKDPPPPDVPFNQSVKDEFVNGLGQYVFGGAPEKMCSNYKLKNDIGAGGAGYGGETGLTGRGRDHASSGGGGGGYGIVFKTTGTSNGAFHAYSGAFVDFRGGDSNSTRAGGKIGPAGGGGVIIIKSSSYSTRTIDNISSFYNVSGGKLGTKVVGNTGRFLLMNLMTVSPVTIKKEIKDNTNTSPKYEVQKGDEVWINLSVTNFFVGQETSIEDSLLVSGDNKVSCSYVESRQDPVNQVSSSSFRSTSSSVGWSFTPLVGVLEVNMSYKCKIEVAS